MRRITISVLIGVILSCNQAASAQEWKEWNKSNPTYQSPITPTQSVEQPSSKSRIFLDQRFTVPAGAEWNREVIANRPGKINIQITSNSLKTITIVTHEAWQKVMQEANPNIDPQQDILLMKDTDATQYSEEIFIPQGRYVIMMQNRSAVPEEFHLRCQSTS